MSQYRIAVLVGSISQKSINRKLAQALIGLAPPDLAFGYVRIDDLPLYNHDNDTQPAASETRLRDEIRRADGLLFVTPEYNRSMPGVLKNALDAGSRPWGQNAWSGKPAGVIGTSTGGPATSMAQQHLRNVLSFLDVSAMRQPEGYIQMREGLIDDRGNVQNEDTKAFLKKWMESYAAWIRKHVVK